MVQRSKVARGVLPDTPEELIDRGTGGFPVREVSEHLTSRGYPISHTHVATLAKSGRGMVKVKEQTSSKRRQWLQRRAADRENRSRSLEGIDPDGAKTFDYLAQTYRLLAEAERLAEEHALTIEEAVAEIEQSTALLRKSRASAETRLPSWPPFKHGPLPDTK